LEKLKAAFNLNRDEITVANHFGLFTPDPVGDKAAMCAFRGIVSTDFTAS
jgi:hypothetical protein